MTKIKQLENNKSKTTMEKKYRLLEDNAITVDGRTLYRIEALRDFGNVKKGDKGGYIQNEYNLSHKGDCWVYGNARVLGNARVYGNAWVYGNACVYGNARVSGIARVYGDARVYGNACVYGYAYVFGNACILGNAQISNGMITNV